MSGSKSKKKKSKKEEKFTLMLQEKLNKELRKYGVIVVKGKHLIYKVIVKEKFKCESDTTTCSTKSSYSKETADETDEIEETNLLFGNLLIKTFETDLLVENLLVKTCEEIINEIKNNYNYKENEEHEKLIEECEELIDLIKNKELINEINNDKEHEKLIEECKDLIENQKYNELINTCEKLINKIKEENPEKEYVELMNKYKNKINNFNKLIKNKEYDKLIENCELLFEEIKNDRYYIKVTKKCKKLVENVKKLINSMMNENEKIKKIKEKFKEELFLLPLVVIEVKYGGFSTHDVLIYSEKALKHKQIYPYLRYGLVVVEKKNKNKEIIITKKFFVHNKGFDFAYVLNDINDNKSIKDLAEMLKEQIDSAHSLLGIFINEKKVKKFNNIVEIK